MDPIIFLKGKRLYLRPILEQDLEKLVIWINDPEIRQFLAAYLPQSPEDERQWLEDLRNKKDTQLTFSIVLKNGDELIGVISLHNINHRQGTATMGFFIGRKDLWNNGYGSEALIILLNYAFDTLNLRKVCSSVYAFNQRSLKAQQKCGFQIEGTLKQQRRYNYGWTDEILLAVFREDFLPPWQEFAKDLAA
ncbi:MAG: GNAT family protein [Patescibacteria group bacterium]